MQINYKGHSIKVESVNDSLRDERDVAVSGALIPALELEGGTVEWEKDESGVVWYKASDITSNLGYKNSAKALGDNVKSSDITVRYTRSSGQGRNVNFVNESGLYSLILGSKLPKAKEFKHWITSEVLPAIRKTGSYNTNRPPLVFRSIGDALAKQHKSIQGTNKTIRQQIGKPIEGERMTRSAVNISKITNALAFGKHYNCEMRQILTEEEAGHLHAVLKAFEGAQKKYPNLSLVEIKEKVSSLFDPMIITPEEIERRLEIKKSLIANEQKKLK